MSDKILESKDFGEKIYKKFPLKYQEDDIQQNYALLRYLKSLGDSGFKVSIEDINGLLELCNPDKIPDEVLPTALRHYGLDVDILESIPPSYLRRLLNSLGLVLLKRGTQDTIEYVLNTIFSGMDPTTVSVQNSLEDNKYVVNINTTVVNGDIVNLPKVSKGVKEIIKKFIPFFQSFSYHFYDNFKVDYLINPNNQYADIIISDTPYVTFDGSHYINLSVYPTNNWEITIDCEWESVGSWVFGSRTASANTQNAYAFGFNLYTTTSIYPIFGDYRNNLRYSMNPNERYTIMLSKNGCYINNGIEVKSKYDDYTFTALYPLFIGSMNQSGNHNKPFKGKVYSVIINDGENIISYSPHTLNGVVGLLDSNNHFYPLQEIV